MGKENLTNKVAADNNPNSVPAEQCHFIQPMNKKYSKWLDDKISVMRMYKPFAHLFQEIHYHFYVRDGRWNIIANSDSAKRFGDSTGDIIKFIKDKGEVSITTSTSEKQTTILYQDGIFSINGNSYKEDELKQSLFGNLASEEIFLINEFIDQYNPEAKAIKLQIINTLGDNPMIGDVFLTSSNWQRIDTLPFQKEIEKAISALCLYTPQIEFFTANMIVTKKGFKIVNLEAESPTAQIGYQKKQVNLKAKIAFAKIVYPRGFDPILDIDTRVLPRFIKDFTSNKDTTLKQKMWSYKNGYLSYRIEQYGIAEENRKDIISDFEYKWLRHINNKYRVWLEDKLTMKYILSDFKECLPAYYYSISLRTGKNRIIKLIDCPNGFGSNYDDIFRLVEEKKVLALKPDEGTHGVGFYKFTYDNEKYYLNNKEASKQKVISLFDDVNNQYLITEFIVMHPKISKIYPYSVNTMRLIVFKKDGKMPQIGNGYMRFGTNQTGGVDNVSAGGISADLDVEKGYFDNPVMLKNRTRLIPTPYHPDTGEKIEGYLPNWDCVKEQILKIAAAIPELEYFGFDVALTEDGIKFPEINRYPDFPKINKLTSATMDYLLHKLEKKKEKYGYMDGTGKRSLIKLPIRNSR